MANDKFSISAALKYGWETFKQHVPFFIVFMVILAAVTVIPDKLIDSMFQQGTALFVIGKLIVRLLGLVLGMVATRLSLDIHDKGNPDFEHLGELSSLVLYYLGGKILYGLIVMVGLILLVVPGCIAAYMFLYTGFLTIDKGLSPIAALQESRVVTQGYKMDLFLFSLAVAGINIVGVICLVVGLFVTVPITLMASAYVYRKLCPSGAVAEAV
jgi:hypothetical protein